MLFLGDCIAIIFIDVFSYLKLQSCSLSPLFTGNDVVANFMPRITKASDDTYSPSARSDERLFEKGTHNHYTSCYWIHSQALDVHLNDNFTTVNWASISNCSDSGIQYLKKKLEGHRCI